LKNFLITLITFFMVLNISFTYNSNIDRTIINTRIRKAISVIENDSLFKSYLEINYGKPSSFFVDDTTLSPFLPSNCFHQLFPNIKRDSLGKIYKSIWISDTHSYILKLDSTFKKKSSNYHISICLINQDLMNFIVFPSINAYKPNCIVITIRYDENNNVITNCSSPYIVSD
jgi:hypothetical protein